MKGQCGEVHLVGGGVSGKGGGVGGEWEGGGRKFHYKTSLRLTKHAESFSQGPEISVDVRADFA